MDLGLPVLPLLEGKQVRRLGLQLLAGQRGPLPTDTKARRHQGQRSRRPVSARRTLSRRRSAIQGGLENGSSIWTRAPVLCAELRSAPGTRAMRVH